MENKPLDSSNKPNNNLVLAIICVVFCWPIGLAGLLKATKVDSLWAAGKHSEAIEAAAEAKKWSTIGLIAGGVMWVLFIIFYVVMIALSMNM